MGSRKVTIPACKVTNRNGHYAIVAPGHARASMIALLKYAHEKRGGFISATYDLPRRPRSTGKNSQNSHVWGHASQIAAETGNDVDDVMKEAKHQAISRGYPAAMDPDGNPIRIYGTDQIKGESTADISVEECKILIDVLHQIAGEFSIKLEEGE